MPSNRAVSSVKQILSLDQDTGVVTSTLASVQDLIDSAYVSARSGGGGGGTDFGDTYAYSIIFGGNNG